MSRRRPGSRNYKFYSDRQMELCLSDIKDNKLTQREASAKYKIPRSSIILKLKAMRNNLVRLPGRQCVFTEEEETCFVNHVQEMCRYGFPVTVFDLRCIVKTYLDKKGRRVEQFSNNIPGRTWAQLFLSRHKNELTQRICSNIKRVRAAVDEEVINNFYDHLKKETEGVPPHLIYNYDETNLVDDPGKKKILTKRGTKYPEAIKNSTKAAVSLMVCGNAAGEVLPPYINYKAEHLWDTWTEGGPPHTRYNRSKSGWFDATSFEDWFFSQVLPVLKKETGKKVIIGDNLSSHISYKVIKACGEHNIAFVALPPNSTHLTQPLDVAYFRPFKTHWRKILDDWKSTREGQINPTIPKNRFPALLNLLWQRMIPRSEANLKAGFLKTGIYPTDPQPVLKRLPTYKHPHLAVVEPELVAESFIEFLENKRKDVIGPGTGGRKKKLSVAAGKSISSEEVKQSQANTSTSQIKKPGNKRKKKQTQPESETESESESESHMEIVDDSDSEGPFIEESDAEEPTTQTPSSAQAGDFVVVEYEQEMWPGQVQTMERDGAYVKCLTRCGLAWKWPQKDDIIFYPLKDIKFKIEPPKKKSTKRALFDIPELEAKWGKSKK